MSGQQWKMVPTEPTAEMLGAGLRHVDGMASMPAAYLAMLDAAPQPPAQGPINVNNAPIGTKAPAFGGGHWCKTEQGWKWNGPNGSGSTFPRPGADWTGRLIAPPDLAAEVERLRAEMTEQCRLLGMSAERELRLITQRDELLAALKRLAFAAETSGGVAGRDDGLVAAINEAAAAIAAVEQPAEKGGAA